MRSLLKQRYGVLQREVYDSLHRLRYSLNTPNLAVSSTSIESWTSGPPGSFQAVCICYWIEGGDMGIFSATQKVLCVACRIF